MQGYLLLADGTYMEGTLFGASEVTLGELVFNTSMTGYQEILTDPSYHKQVVVLTQPEIGNYGCHDEISESSLGRASGMVVRSMSPGTWHRRNRDPFAAFLKNLGVTAIADVDTRHLTRLIRDKGNQAVVIAPQTYPREQAQQILADAPSMNGAALVSEVSVSQPVTHGSGSTLIALLDFGIKAATIRALVDRGCTVVQLPWNTSFETIQAMNPDGIMLSNGPGDPSAVKGVPEVIAQLMDHYPVMGICMGFQLMALALGGETYKLPFGHRGGNHPVKFENKVVITSQNHGFAVKPESLDHQRLTLTHESLFDGSLEGFQLKDKPVFGVQFHPEAAPGPHDCLDHFDYFLSLIRSKGARA